MKIAHASIPADNPHAVAHVLADILQGEALPFPPAGPDAWMAWHRHQDSNALGVRERRGNRLRGWERGHPAFPGAARRQCRGRRRSYGA